MVIERRGFLAATMLLASGCAKAAPSPPLPPRHRAPVGWDRFKADFLLPEGRIADSGNGGISHSEGQGYGLLLAEAAGDRAAFEQLLGWTEATLAQGDLFAWRFEPGRGVTDRNNASDGDILIAWALMRAAARWPDRPHGERARAIRAAIRRDLVRREGGRTLLLPGKEGFAAPGRTTINLSYYVWPALDAFRAADGAVWSPLIADGEVLLVTARAGPLQLPTDWSDVTADGRVAPAAQRPPRFGFDAVRIPLYATLGRRRAGCETITRFWRSYAAQGKPIPAWVDVASGETAPYPLSPGGYAVARRLLGVAPSPQPRADAADYYSNVLALLAQLA